VEIVFAVMEKMFSVSKIVIFLVEKTIGESQKLFSEAEIIFCTSETVFSMPEKIVGEAPTAFVKPPNKSSKGFTAMPHRIRVADRIRLMARGQSPFTNNKCLCCGSTWKRKELVIGEW
jgi:hypothetical protein